MPLTATGMGRARRALLKITPAIEQEFEKANRDNAELIVSTSKALISTRSGVSRALIKNVADGEGQIIDFGPLSKILEGGTEQRFTKSGANRGAGPARPFVNPAMSATKRKRNTRNRKAVKDGLRLAKNG